MYKERHEDQAKLFDEIGELYLKVELMQAEIRHRREKLFDLQYGLAEWEDVESWLKKQRQGLEITVISNTSYRQRKKARIEQDPSHKYYGKLMIGYYDRQDHFGRNEGPFFVDRDCGFFENKVP